MPHSEERPLRRDAARNRERILRAAHEVFAARGADVSLDDVAAHAGVGVGTLYRRFPNREVLFEALFAQRFEELVALAERAGAVADPWEAFTGAVLRVAEELAENRGLRDLVVSGAPPPPRLVDGRNALLRTMSGVLERAQEAGVVRDDLEPADLPLIQFMVDALAAHTAATNPGVWRRYLALIFDGLRARPDRAPLPRPAPALADLDRPEG